MDNSEEVSCRLCLKEGPIPSMINLNKNENLIKAIFLITSITVQETEEHPAYMCRKCLSDLHHCISFRQACLFNNVIYRQILEQKSDSGRKEQSPVQLPEQIFIKEMDEINDDDDEDFKVEDPDDDGVPDDANSVISEESSSDHETLASVKAKLDVKPESLEKPSKEMFPCKQCSEVFQEQQSLVLHDLAVHQNCEMKHACKVCDKSFPSFTARIRHQKEAHPDYKAHGCETCGKRFKAKSDLRIHIRIHTGERPFECDICNKKLIASNALAAHKRSAHGTGQSDSSRSCNRGPGKYPCDECDKSYSGADGLRTHKLAIHSAEPKFECKTCGQKFNRRSSQRYHEKTVHTENRPYQCEYCEKAFKAKPEWIVHLRLHTGDWPYMCEQCGKRFYCSSNAKKHKKIHVNETLNAHGKVVRRKPKKRKTKKKDEVAKEEEEIVGEEVQ